MGVNLVLMYKVLWGDPLIKNGRPDNGNTAVPIQTVTNDVALTDSELSAEMEWIRFREQTLGPSAYSEDPASKLIRKIKENPFVPIGALATLGALSNGLWCMRQGRGRDSQMMMRARILAQGFTVTALMSGVVVEGARGVEKRLKANK